MTTPFIFPVWALIDSLRHSKTLRSANALRLWIQGRLSADIAAATHLSRALAFSEHSTLTRYIGNYLVRRFPPESSFELWTKVVTELPRYRQLTQKDPHLTRSIILKAPGENGEKGVLLMYFEYNWVRLALGLTDEEFRWLDSHYDLILSTSWSPTDYAALALLLGKTRGPLFVQPCNFLETEKLSGCHPRISVLKSLPCDWINPEFYTSEPGSKRPIDILMVANWGVFKRHWEFFKALGGLPSDLRVVLVGQPEGGRDAVFIRRLASKIGVPQQIEIFESIPVEQVAKLQTQSKVSVIFTRREGCCVAAVESLFAGCALGMRADAHVGPLQYINPSTGLRLRSGHLSEDLLRLLEISQTLKPAEWAAQNISCHQTRVKVNDHLRTSALQRSLPWTIDLALPHWRPYPTFCSVDERDRLKVAYDDLSSRFPAVFKESLIDNSHR